MNQLIMLLGPSWLNRADTYSKLPDNFVRFVCMLANSGSSGCVAKINIVTVTVTVTVTNSRLSQPPSQDSADPLPDSLAAQVGSLFSRMRVQIGAAIAKAAAASFVPTVRTMASLFLFFGTRQQPLNLPFHYLRSPSVTQAWKLRLCVACALSMCVYSVIRMCPIEHVWDAYL
jgi:hypothetical protein